MATVADNVAAILELYPPARENNNLLVVLYWQACEGLHLDADTANKIAQATSVESIVRAKREVIERSEDLEQRKNQLAELKKKLEGSSNGDTKTS